MEIAPIAAGLGTLLRVGVGSVFVAAGISKLNLGHARLTKVIGDYQVLSRPVALTMAAVLPPLEIVTGAVLVLGVWTRSAALIAGALLVIFAGVMALAIRRGTTDTCGCFGRALEQRLRWRLVARNLALLAIVAAIYLADGGALTADEFLDSAFASSGGVR